MYSDDSSDIDIDIDMQDAAMPVVVDSYPPISESDYDSEEHDAAGEFKTNRHHQGNNY
jgi:hypothetical protein